MKPFKTKAPAFSIASNCSPCLIECVAYFCTVWKTGGKEEPPISKKNTVHILRQEYLLWFLTTVPLL